MRNGRKRWRYLGELHESHHELITLRILVCAWGEMAYRYIAAVKEGKRKNGANVTGDCKERGVQKEGVDAHVRR